MTHNHQHCITDALETAEQLCQQRQLRFTKLRRRVLELIWTNHKPVGAYQLLKALKTTDDMPAPPTVYRALDFLLQQGFIHRIASLNAFIGCCFADRQHVSQFLICNHCHNATELHDKRISGLIYKSAHDQDFKPQQQVLEVFGLCHSCQSAH
ncbi:MAG: Fur family transcriptional regulator [Pseudomonadota bacterium]